ncbi:MAG TPA: ATP-dependent sacrificial sulfur transferase LarE, partial [Candidatus Thermoplasmatota archaeon]|nr:ATP-dependent sacrificial sulfur transferase LarE [Candidatus Thermoplasmatota archaeon]
AHDALGDRAVAAISDSPTLPREELLEARATAHHVGIGLIEIRRSELDDPRFVENPTNRCYFCKAGLQDELSQYAASKGFATVTYGVNMSDLGEWRPGISAAKERGARFPLVDIALDKTGVRALSRALGLPVWDKPASPCLSSRIPYGEVITIDKLRRVEAAESFVRNQGFRDLRVRSLDGVARVEVPGSDVGRLLSLRAEIVPRLRDLGFRDVVLDDRGFRSGRLNEEHGGVPHA